MSQHSRLRIKKRGTDWDATRKFQDEFPFNFDRRNNHSAKIGVWQLHAALFVKDQMMTVTMSKNISMWEETGLPLALLARLQGISHSRLAAAWRNECYLGMIFERELNETVSHLLQVKQAVAPFLLPRDFDALRKLLTVDLNKIRLEGLGGDINVPGH